LKFAAKNMYQVFLEGNKEPISVDINIRHQQVSGVVNHQPFTAEIEKTHPFEYYIRYNHHSYNILILKVNNEEKTLTLKINGKRVTLQVKDKFDLLLQQLGMDKAMSKKVENIKAPMPGKIIDVLVSEGQAVKKGDTLLILEAMKMENALKAPHDGIVKKVYISKGIAVEKNQPLIEI
jgi:biotin carboxyl carrier protein